MFVWPKYLRGDAIVSFRQREKTCEATLWETSGTARGSQMLEIGAQNFFDIPSCADEYSISGGWITLATDGTATGEAPPWLADHSLRGKFAMWDTQLWCLHPEKLTWISKVSPFFQRKIFFQTNLYFLGIQKKMFTVLKIWFRISSPLLDGEFGHSLVWGLVLSGLPASHRHVSLTAEACGVEPEESQILKRGRCWEMCINPPVCDMY